MGSESVELGVEVEVEERAVGGGGDARVEHPRGGGDGAVGFVVRVGFDVRGGGRDGENVHVAVDAERVVLAGAGAGVARQDQEGGRGKVVDLALGGHFARCGAVGHVEREGDDVFGRVLGFLWVRDVVLEEAGLSTVGVLRAAFLIQGGLHERVEGVAVGADGQAFEALIVVTSALGIFRVGHGVGIINRWGIGVETDTPVPAREYRGGGLDGGQHLPFGGEVIDVRPVLVADPIPAILGQDESFAVERDPLSTSAWSTKSIAGIRGLWQQWEAGEMSATFNVWVQAGHGVALGVAQQDGVEVLELNVGWRRISDRGGVVQRERDPNLVDPVLEIDGPLGVPSAIGQSVQRATVFGDLFG